MCAIGIAVLFQIVNIQFVHGEYYRNLADSLTTTYRTIPANRGNVYDENGFLLATSLPYFEIRFDAYAASLKPDTFKKYRDTLAIQLSNHFKDASSAEYANILQKARNTKNRYTLLKRKASYIDYVALRKMAMLKPGKRGGAMISIQSNKRVMPFKDLALRTIGYVRDTSRAQSIGLEKTMDKYLAGQDGKRLMQRIAGGWIPINDDNEIEPVNGYDVITTLDIELQDLAEHSLLKTLQNNNALHGSAIVMEVETGEIKAIANLGLLNGEYVEDYNYAIGEKTEPGSTFKTASFLALIDDFDTDTAQLVQIGNGTWTTNGKTVRDAEGHGNITEVSMAKAFAISSNVATAKLVTKYYANKPQDFVDKLKSFGLGDMTGIELSGEKKPTLRGTKDAHWSRLSLPWMSFGYEVSFTPLQILTFYNAIANDGKMMKPFIVKEIKNQSRTIEKFNPEVVQKRIASKSSIKTIKQLLEMVIKKGGTASNIYTENIALAGKTGTTQLNYQGENTSAYQSSFAGYFPAENPKYSCIVVVNTPRNGVYYGGYVAAPVFKEIAEKYYAKKSLKSESLNKILKDSVVYLPSVVATKKEANYLYDELEISTHDEAENSDWVRYSANENSVHGNTVKILPNLMPNLVGMGLRDAVFLLENHKVKVKIIGHGKVKRQSKNVGERLQKGETVLIEAE